MERDKNIILFGEDVELAIFGDTREVFARFGPKGCTTRLSARTR
jgi:pyruvate dehydrogenase E1 component beta subunit